MKFWTLLILFSLIKNFEFWKKTENINEIIKEKQKNKKVENKKKQKNLAGMAGLEPTAGGFGVRCSTN